MIIQMELEISDLMENLKNGFKLKMAFAEA